MSNRNDRESRTGLTRTAEKQPEADVRTAFANSAIGIFMTDSDGHCLQANPAFCRLVGYSEEELRERDHSSLTHPDDRPRVLEKIRQLKAGEVSSVTVEKRFLRKGGGVVWVRASISLQKGESPEEDCVVALVEDTTARKAMEDQLMENGILLRIAGRVARFGGWVVDLNASRVFWSDEVAAIHEEPPGTHPSVEEGLHYYTPESQAIIRRVFHACTSKGVPFDEELEIITANGRRRSVRSIGQPARELDGSIVRVQGAFQDITEIKERAAETKRLASRLANTLESITDAFFTLDRDWRFTYLNSECERLLRRSREELLGCVVWDEFEDAVGTIFESEYRRAMAETQTVTFEAYYDPLRLWLEVRAYPSEEGLAVYFRDITQKKETDQRVREQASLLDETQDAIMVTDLEHRVTYWNRSAERLYGWSAEESIGRSVTELMHKDSALFHEATVQTLKTGEWSGDLSMVSKDGAELLVEGRWKLLRDETGGPEAILAVNTDVTEKRRIEDQFLRAQRIEAIGTLASGVAHDLNNILSPILMSIGVLRLEKTTPRMSEILDGIEMSTRRGADVVRQVLSFSRGVEGERVLISPTLLIEEVESIVGKTFPKSIACRTRVPKDAWAIVGDPTQLHQVLLNLAINARDAMPRGGDLTLAAENVVIDEKSPEIQHEGKPGPHVMLSVADQGTGIPAGLLAKIFDPFFSTKEQGKGTGLGLATVSTIVRSHGGFLEVYSEEEKGTIFRLYFPAERDEDCEGHGPEVPEVLPRGQGELVLVVDDEAAVRAIAKQTLTSFGYRVALASSGADALSFYAEHGSNVAVVLTDMMMPIMDGPQMIRVLRKMNPDVYIIATSGLEEEYRATVSAGSTGIKSFLPKPFSTGQLLRAVRQAITEEREAP